MADEHSDGSKVSVHLIDVHFRVVEPREQWHQPLSFARFAGQQYEIFRDEVNEHANRESNGRPRDAFFCPDAVEFQAHVVQEVNRWQTANLNHDIVVR